MAKTLTLRLDASTALTLKALMVQTGEKTASKAILQAMKSYTPQLSATEKLRAELMSARSEVDKLKDLMLSSQDSATAFLSEIKHFDLAGD